MLQLKHPKSFVIPYLHSPYISVLSKLSTLQSLLFIIHYVYILNSDEEEQIPKLSPSAKRAEQRRKSALLFLNL